MIQPPPTIPIIASNAMFPITKPTGTIAPVMAQTLSSLSDKIRPLSCDINNRFLPGVKNFAFRTIPAFYCQTTILGEPEHVAG
jgi:hypothetical protein